MSIQALSQFIGDPFHASQQAVISVICKFKKIRNDSDVFQKIGQIAVASLQLIMLEHPATKSLANLSIVISAVSMHDFCRVLQYPRHWFFPITAEVIDQHVVRDALYENLYKKLEVRVANDPALNDDDHKKQLLKSEASKLKKIIENCLIDQLNLMNANNDGYRNLEEFVGQLEKRFRKLGHPYIDFPNIDLSKFVTKDLSKNDDKSNDYTQNVSTGMVYKVPTLEKITNIHWAVVDCLTVALSLKEWGLLDTAKLAETIGQHHAFQWVKNQKLECWLIGLVCTSFSWKLLESVRRLRDEELSTNGRHQTRWDAVTSLAELTYFGSIFTNLIGKTNFSSAHVQILAITAKSLGLLSIFTRPNYEVF